MDNFAVKKIKSIKGKTSIEQLVITKDVLKEEDLETEKGVWEIFKDSAEDKYESALLSIEANMQRVADLQPMAQQKFKDITPAKETVKEYEFKQGDIRVYAIKIPDGKLIILCGYKNTQKKDITRFRSIKKTYLQSLK